MAGRTTGHTGSDTADRARRERRGGPARGVAIGLLIAAPCWLAIGYGLHLLIGRL